MVLVKVTDHAGNVTEERISREGVEPVLGEAAPTGSDTIPPEIGFYGSAVKAAEEGATSGSYELHIAAVDGAPTAPQSGVAKIEVGVDGTTLQYWEKSCPVGSCHLEVTWPYAPGNFPGGGHVITITVRDHAGNVITRTIEPSSFPRLLAAYPFEEGSGSVTEDVSGNGHTGTLSGKGVEWTPGKYGTALKFDGKEGCVTVPDSPALQLHEEFTLEAWVRPEGELLHLPAINKQAEGFPAYGLGVGMTTAGRAEGQIGTAAKSHIDVASPTAISANVWTHEAVTFDGANLRLYLNGVLVATKAVALPASGVRGPLEIGCSSGGHFRGSIDEVHIYGRALQAAQVTASMGPIPSAQPAGASGVEETEALLTAKLNPHGFSTEFRFEYGTTTTYGKTAPEAPSYNEQPESGNEPVEVEEWVDELEPATTYHYRLVATSSLGTVFGRDQTFTTGEATFGPLAENETPRKVIVGTNWNGINPPLGAGLEGLVEKSGSKIFRIPIGKNCDIEPTEKEKLEHKKGYTGAACAITNELFLSFAKRGITILPNLVGINTGFEREAYGNGKEIPPLQKTTAEGKEAREFWKKELRELFDEYGPEGHFWTVGAGKNYAKFAPKWWEIWNEPNWGTQGSVNAGETGKEIVGTISPGRFGELLEVTHEAVVETKQPVKILFGGILAVHKESPGALAAPHMRIKEFVEKVKHTEDYDGLGLHPYAFSGRHPCPNVVPGQSPGPCPPITEADVPTITHKVRNLIAAARTALRNTRKTEEGEVGGKAEEEKPIWITELGWPVEAADPAKASEVYEDRSHRLVSEAIQAKLLTSTFDMIKADSQPKKQGKVPGYNIEALLYYNIQDNAAGTPKPNPEEEGPQSWDNRCGLVQALGGAGGGTGSKRPSWEAFQSEAK